MDNAFDIIPKNGKTKFLYSELKEKVLYKSEGLPLIGSAFRNKRTDPGHYGKMPIISAKEGKKELIRAVEAGKPYMAGRFGTTEGLAMMNCIKTYYK